MSDVNKLLHDLAQQARSEPAQPIDVRARVTQTLSSRLYAAPLDISPIVFAGVSVAIAAGFLIALLPTWMTLTDPWVAYLP